MATRNVSFTKGTPVSASDPYAEATRQRALADELRARAMKQRDFGTASRGQAITQGLTQLAEALIARRAGKKATGLENASNAAMQKTIQSQVGSLMPDTPDSPGFETQTGTVVGDVDGPDAQMAQRRQQMIAALSGQDPRAVSSMLAQKQMERAMPEPISPTDQAQMDTQRAVVEDAAKARAEEGKLRRESEIQQLQMRLADARITTQEKMAMEQRLADLTAETARSGQANARAIAEMGNTTRAEIAAAAAAAAKEKADAAAAAKAQPAEQGKGVLDDQIASLRDMYTQLQESGGITDTTKDAASNASAYARSSGPGQFAGKVFGTKDQSLRNSIQQTRPLLLQSIKQATGMSAQQMNSNVELKLFLDAATDPQMDVQANLRALDGLEQFAKSGRLPSAATITAPTATAAAPRQFSTEAEAEASGIKGEVIINGRKAIIE